MASDNEARGCLFVIGLTMVGCAIGILQGAVYGWLFVGAILIVLAIIG